MMADEKKGGGKVKKKKTSKTWKDYVVQGTKLERKNRFCPKCGVGFFMALHKNRVHCGKCGYTEMTTTTLHKK